CLSLASAVSLNIETAGQKNFQRLSIRKDYSKDILKPLQLISRLTARGSAFEGVQQTTQFVVGASTETDGEIIRYSWKLYRELNLSRVYFSAYQRGLGTSDLPGEISSQANGDLLTREHRLYQVDWLIRKYGFRGDEIPLNTNGNLALDVDPKEAWARAHPEFFPVNVNRDDQARLLRVPGLGQVSVDNILTLRRSGHKLRSLDQIGRLTKLLQKAQHYLIF
ncbi:MAG: radical SAM protein, partial [Candidatus Omnitrophota bacterium]